MDCSVSARHDSIHVTFAYIPSSSGAHICSYVAQTFFINVGPGSFAFSSLFLGTSFMRMSVYYISDECNNRNYAYPIAIISLMLCMHE